MFYTSIEGGHVLSWNSAFSELINLSANQRPKVLNQTIGEKALFWYDIKGKSTTSFEAKLKCFGGEKYFELSCHVDLMKDLEQRPMMCFCVVMSAEEIENEFEAHEKLFSFEKCTL
jgi:hypothetical protein